MNGRMGLKVTEIKEDSEALVWDRYALGHPAAQGYHLTAWRRVLEESFGHRTLYLMARDGSENVRGILPMVFVSSRLFGRFLVSLPFFTYGGLLADTPEAQNSLLDAAVDRAKALRADYIELRHEGELPSLGWPCKRHKVSMRLDLPAQFDTLMSGFSSNVRRRIRRAQKEGMTVRTGGLGILDGFYQVFSRNMRDLGTPVYKRGFFSTVLKYFPKDARILAVYLKDRPLAAGLVYGFRNLLEIPWVSSDRRYNHLAANMLLYNCVLEHACQEGFRVFDFGRSSPDSGTYRFKEQWGAKPVPLHWYYWLASGDALPDLSPRNPRYGLAINLWQRLPISATRLVGPFLSKYLP